MEMYFLLIFYGRGAAFAPEKYTLEQCDRAGLAYSSNPVDHKCIPAPKLDSYCAGNIPNTPYVFSYPCYTTTGK